MTGGGAQRATAQSGEFNEPIPFGLARVLGVLVGQVTIVHRRDGTALVFGNIAAPQDPVASQGRQTFGDISLKGGITPRTGAIVDPDGLVHLDLARPALGGMQFDLAHRDLHIGMQGAGDVDLGGAGQGRAAVGFDELGFGDHGRRTE